MSTILLVGSSEAMLEGISQTLSAVGRTPHIATSLHDAQEIASGTRPLIAVVERSLAELHGPETLSLPLAPGGALVLFRSSTHEAIALSPALRRVVLADLTLPLERNRLMALVQHAAARARTTGRDADGREEMTL